MKPTTTNYPDTFGASATEREYLDTLAQIELRRLRIKRLEENKLRLIAEINQLECVAQDQREAAL